MLPRLAIGGATLALVLTGTLGAEGYPAPAGAPSQCPGGQAPRPAADRVNGARAFALLKYQVALGPRPAGSPASRRLAARLRRLLPHGRFQSVPGGLRNVIGKVPGRDRRRVVVVGAHYDTKDLPGFVGANDGAAGTAAVVELARSVRPGRLRPTVYFVLFDGEETPAGSPDSELVQKGLRGSRVAAASLRRAEAMVLLDFIGDKDLSIPRERNSDPQLWRRLQSAARRVGVECVFPPTTTGGIQDDHLPFLWQRVPAIDLIDTDFPCFHRPCDDLSAVSRRSVDATSEAVFRLLVSL